MCVLMNCNRAIPIFDTFHTMCESGRMGENMDIMKDRVCKTVADRTHILDDDRQTSVTVTCDFTYAIFIVFKIMQSMKCLPIVISLVYNGEIIGLQRLPVEPSA